MAFSIWSCVKEVMFLQDLCGIQYMVMCKRSDVSIGFVWHPVYGHV